LTDPGFRRPIVTEHISHLLKPKEAGMKRTKSNVLVAAAVAVLALSAAEAAWACTTQQQLTLLPRTGVAGSPVVVTGTGFDGSPVTIRWNSTTGPAVGSAQPASVSSFSAPAAIPADAAPGVYYLVAVSKGMVARAAISVQAPAAASSSNAPAATTASVRVASDDLWTGLQSRPTSISTDQATPDQGPAGRAMTAGLALAAAGIGGSAATGLIIARKRTKARRNSV